MPKHSQSQVSVLLHTVQYACPLCVGVFRLPPVLTWKTDMIFGRHERGGCRRLTSHFGSRVIRCRKSYRLTCPARHPLSSCAVVVRCRRPLSSSAVVVRCRRALRCLSSVHLPFSINVVPLGRVLDHYFSYVSASLSNL